MKGKLNKIIAIFGATSAVAQALAKLHAQKGDSLILIARNEKRLESIAEDLKIRGASEVRSLCADLTEIEKHSKLLNKIDEINTRVDSYYFFYGVLSNQKECEGSWDATYDSINTNFLSKISLLNLIANKVEKESGSKITVVSSVAGDRGRQSNYIYGTAKGALTVYLQGLRNRLSKSGSVVTTVKPGFIDTPMTKDFSKNFLWSSPDVIAKDIYKASMKEKSVIYSPWFWRYIMLIIKVIPESIFKKLSL